MNRFSGVTASTEARGVTTASLCLLLTCLAMLTGCSAFQEEIPVEIGDILSSDPLVEPLPLTVGVYYGPDLIERNELAPDYAYRHGELRTVWSYQLPLGTSSMAAFDRVFGAMFERTVKIDRIPPAPKDRAGLDAVIEPRIVAARRRSILYEFAFATPAGEEIARWMVEGTADRQKGSNPSEQARLEIRRAVRNAMAKFMLSFGEQYQVRDWLDGRANQNRVAAGGLQEGGG